MPEQFPDLPPNTDNPLRNTLAVGQGSCGKTTMAIRALLNVPWTCAFIFDLNGIFSRRLKQPWVATAAQCDAALASRWVCFNPYRMFGAHETDKAFEWFCEWSFGRSKKGLGRKVLVADDAWAYVSKSSLLPHLANVVKIGRFWELEFFGITHRPMEFNIAVRAQVTEWIAFNLLPDDLEDVEEYWPGVRHAEQLPKYEWLAYHRPSRVEGRYKITL